MSGAFLRKINHLTFLVVLLGLWSCSPEGGNSLNSGFAVSINPALRNYFAEHDYRYFEQAKSRKWIEDMRATHPLRTRRLSNEHLAAIRAITSDKLYYHVNYALGTGDPKLIKPHIEYIETLTTALARLPREPILDSTTLYRRMPFKRVEDFGVRKVGDVLRTPTFLSTSLRDLDYIVDNPSLLLRIESEYASANGRNISFFSEFPKEQEVLYPPGEYFQVTKEAYTGKKVTLGGGPLSYYVVELKNLKPGSCKSIQ